MKEITAIELQNLLKNEEILIVDVRTAEEYAQAHLKNAFLMELHNFNQEKLEQKCEGILGLKKVIFQCRSGVRSVSAIELLSSRFPYESYNLQGGIIAWVGRGYEVILNDGE
ncbi:MAG: rhodanese-like domain-containing protein [Alphaproteobacteria bacterium]|jgi:rhodanese-related sulfurtransferase|nr:rhodanese-like domain-containing protein [Alphaproteobacteria bacterium]